MHAPGLRGRRAGRLVPVAAAMAGQVDGDDAEMRRQLVRELIEDLQVQAPAMQQHQVAAAPVDLVVQRGHLAEGRAAAQARASSATRVSIWAAV